MHAECICNIIQKILQIINLLSRPAKYVSQQFCANLLVIMIFNQCVILQSFSHSQYFAPSMWPCPIQAWLKRWPNEICIPTILPQLLSWLKGMFYQRANFHFRMFHFSPTIHHHSIKKLLPKIAFFLLLFHFAPLFPTPNSHTSTRQKPSLDTSRLHVQLARYSCVFVLFALTRVRRCARAIPAKSTGVPRFRAKEEGRGVQDRTQLAEKHKRTDVHKCENVNTWEEATAAARRATETSSSFRWLKIDGLESEGAKQPVTERDAAASAPLLSASC